MRLCFVNINPEEVSGHYLAVCRRLFARVCEPGTQVDIKCVQPGLQRAYDVNYSYFSLLNKVSIAERILEAAQEGYDAAVVGCCFDPAVQEAREVVDIPVVGLFEASAHLALQLGRRFAVVTLAEPKALAQTEQLIDRYGLRSFTIPNPVRPVSTPSREWMKHGPDNPQMVAEDVLDKARGAARDGAEVVVVACAGLGPLCTLAGLHAVEEFGVPILDCLSVGLKTAEHRVALSRRLPWTVASRAGLYASPRPKDVQRVRETFGLAARQEVSA